MARALELSAEEAQWMERVMADRGWLRAVSMPRDGSVQLVDRKLRRPIGADLFITAARIDALVYYRNERSP